MIINFDGKTICVFALQTVDVEVDDNQIGCCVVHKSKFFNSRDVFDLISFKSRNSLFFSCNSTFKSGCKQS